FEINPRTLEIHDFNQNLQSEDDNQFLLKLTDLAYDILESITSAHINSSEPLRNNTIYLAEVSADQVKNRDKLKRSLLLTGYRILPNHSLITSDNYEKDVKDAIELCVLSIHMLGELYGESYRSSDYSYQELQNRYFQDVWQDQKDSNRYHSFIKRIIWMPPQLEPFDEKQIQYIKRINREINTSENTELVQSTLSDLKILIDQNIKKLTEPQESKQSIDTKDLLIIADDHELSNSYIVKETFARTQVNYQFL